MMADFSHEEQEQQKSFSDRIIFSYAAFMVNRPYVNALVVLLLLVLAGVLGFVQPVAQDLPDFSNPTQGFEAWGTTLSSRQNALSRLPHVSGLSTKPKQILSSQRKRRAAPLNFCQTSIKYYINAMATVYEAVPKGSNILTLENLRSICKLHNRVVEQNPSYQVARINRFIGNKSMPCPSYSLPNIIASRYFRTSCQDITQSDLNHFSTLLTYCAQFYRSGKLAQCSEKSICTDIPANCSRNPDRDQFYNIYHYLADTEFGGNPSHLKLLINVELLSDPWSQLTTENVYKSVYDDNLKDLSKTKEGNVKIAAFNYYELRFTIFNSLLLKEAAFISVALILVMIFIWIFSGSLFIAVMTFACVIFALILSYFLYGVIFRLSFFPFLNITTLIFLVGIGADDAFVYVGIWNEAKRLNPYVYGKSYSVFLTQWTAYTVKHAVVAMFVTSFTTAAAFYATVTTRIIAIKCFSIFAGTSILTNYFLMVTFFPVVVILYEKYFIVCTNRCLPGCCPPRSDYRTPVPQEIPKADDTMQIDNGPSDSQVQLNSGRREEGFHMVLSTIDRLTSAMFEKYLPMAILKLRYFWILLFLGLGIGGLIVVFVEPKLNLPLSQDFQMFSSSSSLEQYTLNYKKQFPFSRSSSGFFVDAVLVFGVKAKDTRSQFNPDDKGSTELQPSFDISSKAAQLWLQKFCLELTSAPFIRSKYIAFCENYRSMWTLLGAPCSNIRSLNAPCCNLSHPAMPHVYDYCLRSFARNTSSAGSYMLFDQSGRTRVLSFSIPLKYEYRDSYTYNKDLFHEMEKWIKPRMESAPGGYKDGFWVVDMGFFDLQTALAVGTQQSLAIAVAIAFLVVLLTTWNPLMSLYAIISITCVIAVTVGTLVLAGWRLNILESIVFSVAAGLSIDFTLHYGVAYQSSPDKTDRVERVKYALRHIGAAVTMGAITTFVAGVAMSPASILAYIQMSHFLMLVMTVSWLYGTFFFLPLCAVIGPTGEFCQFSLSKIRKPRKADRRVNDKKISLTMEEVPRPSPMPVFKSDSGRNTAEA